MDAPARVLVVEDNALIAVQLCHMLNNMGYESLDPFPSGEDAVEQVKALNPDVILMDIRLRGCLNGIEAAREIRHRSRTPVIFLTAHSDDTLIAEAKATEPYGFLVKPLNERELFATIETTLVRHGLEKQLTAEKERLKAIFSSINDGIIATDDQGAVDQMNLVAERLLGYTLSEVKGRPLDEVLQIISTNPAETLPEMQKKSLKERSDSRRVQTAYVRLKSVSGKEHPVALSITPTRDASRKNLGMVIILRDTAREIRMQEEILQTSKLRSVATLVGGVAHDFNNLLMSIGGAASLGLHLVDDNKKLRSLLETIKDATFRGKEISDKLLTFSSGRPPEKRVTSLRELVEEFVRFVLSGYPHNLNFQTVESLWPAEVDERQFSQAISNLALNAAQAMPDGGTIHVNMENLLVSPDLEDQESLILENGPYLKITVKDQGVGMDGKTKAQIFDPFFSTKQGNAGLGLSSAYAIVRAHGGLIDVESAPGEGSCFTIFLPAKPNVEHAAV